MKRFTLALAAIVVFAAISNSAGNANAQLLDSISRSFTKTTQRKPLSTCPSRRPILQPQPPAYGQPPVYTQPRFQPPVRQQPVYQPPVYAQPVVTQPATPNPIVVAPTPAVPPNPNASKDVQARAKQLGNVAKEQFRSNQYGKAKATLDQLVKLVPNDSSAWQFRGIVSFSMGNFEAAAADVYDALRLGKAWPKQSIVNLYGDYKANYAIQLSKLNESVAQKPSMQGHFLQAYHHMVNEQFAEGKKELESVLKLQPNEPLSKKLLVYLDQQLAQK